MISPSGVITTGDKKGRYASQGLPLLQRCTAPRADTSSSPVLTRTAASPTLKATIKSNPKAMRCSATALSNTTRAAGQGIIPPVMPRVSNAP